LGIKGYVYICRMRHEGKTYYKIGRTLDLGKRELALKNANPFLEMIAKKASFYHQKEEKDIHWHLKPHHFNREWYELTDEQYLALYNDFRFETYTEEERAGNLKQANRRISRRNIGDFYHVFKKPKIVGGQRVHRWYYYYEDEKGKKIQKACKGCKSRRESNDYVKNLGNPV